VTYFMHVLANDCYLQFKPDNYASPWVRIDAEKAGPQGIFRLQRRIPPTLDDV